jgi:uncharacterized UBP type Zn finger protein
MNPQPPSVKFVAVVLERGGRDEMRVVPLCARCGELVLDVTQANIAVSGHRYDGMTPAGKYLGAKVSRLNGYAEIFCWACDRKEAANNVPWSNLAETLRNHDDPAQQRLAPGFRCVTKCKPPEVFR